MKFLEQILTSIFVLAFTIAVSVLLSLAGCDQPIYSQSLPPMPTNHVMVPPVAIVPLVISNAAPGQTIDLVTTLISPGITNIVTNEIRLPAAFINPASNTLSITRSYFHPPINNFLVAMIAPPADGEDDNYTNCALFSAATLNGPWHWLGSFPNEGQPVALMVANNGSNQFFRAANMFTPTE